jgi:hypothetical protein
LTRSPSTPSGGSSLYIFTDIHENADLAALVDQVGYVLITEGKEVNVGEWQSKDVSAIPQYVTTELQNTVFEVQLPSDGVLLGVKTGATMPWAEDHFQERVSGIPYNPPPSASYWNKNKDAVDEHRTIEEDGEMVYSHTYPERFWPKQAGDEVARSADNKVGIRFEYGDLDDVVSQLLASPWTRQAVLPMWFPEDTGAVHGERVPCTLHYHFMMRDMKLHTVYAIRSCDYVRHFRNDVYLAGRLAQWILGQLQHSSAEPDIWEQVEIGTLKMDVSSMHCFAGDLAGLRRKFNVN